MQVWMVPAACQTDIAHSSTRNTHSLPGLLYLSPRLLKMLWKHVAQWGRSYSSPSPQQGLAASRRRGSAPARLASGGNGDLSKGREKNIQPSVQFPKKSPFRSLFVPLPSPKAVCISGQSPRGACPSAPWAAFEVGLGARCNWIHEGESKGRSDNGPNLQHAPAGFCGATTAFISVLSDPNKRSELFSKGRGFFDSILLQMNCPSKGKGTGSGGGGGVMLKVAAAVAQLAANLPSVPHFCLLPGVTILQILPRSCAECSWRCSSFQQGPKHSGWRQFCNKKRLRDNCNTPPLLHSLWIPSPKTPGTGAKAKDENPEASTETLINSVRPTPQELQAPSSLQTKCTKQTVKRVWFCTSNQTSLKCLSAWHSRARAGLSGGGRMLYYYLRTATVLNANAVPVVYCWSDNALYYKSFEVLGSYCFTP